MGLEAVRFKHDGYLQRPFGGFGYFGHTALLDPGEVDLRRMARLFGQELAGVLAAANEGCYAGSPLHTPTPPAVWQHCGERVVTSGFHHHQLLIRSDTT